MGIFDEGRAVTPTCTIWKCEKDSEHLLLRYSGLWVPIEHKSGDWRFTVVKPLGEHMVGPTLRLFNLDRHH